MAKHKYQKALVRLLREIVKYVKTLTGQFVRWFTRSFFVTNRRRRGQAGFVLPTIAFMLMVVALVVTAILFRTFTRTEQVIREGQQQIIANAATPAIERAKSKIEYLFIDPTLPRDIPQEKRLEELLLNVDNRNPDPYKFNDETRVTNIPGIQGLDVDGTTAWSFDTDTDPNKAGPELKTIYAIIARSERDAASIDPAKSNYKKDEKDRANAFLVSNSPLVSQSGNERAECPVPSVSGQPVGWFNARNSTATVYKNFQVYAVTVPYSLINGKATANTSIATLQYQQDRAFQRGNRWGAWFRSDLEIAPGPRLNWNGAFHSQGNIIVRSQDGFRSFLISSPDSCLYNEKNPVYNSEITLRKDAGSLPGGQFITGQIRLDDFNPQNVSIDISPPTSSNPNTNIKIVETGGFNQTQSQDSVTVNGTPKQMQVATDPLSLHVRGVSQSRQTTGNTTWLPDTAWEKSSPLTKRISQTISCAPYVDDTYRADNRYGPKPSYNKENFSSVSSRCEAAPEGTYGQVIPASRAELTRNDPPTGDLEGENVGLDGYWERRARFNGLRAIVGQRLELGNPFGWNVDRDGADQADQALYPPNAVHPAAGLAGRANEGKQYTTLRDNLAAVQATAIYHYTQDNGNFPIAFVATTSHPGSYKTIQDSTTFRNITGINIITNFLTGEGTNGWEFAPPTLANFTANIGNANSALRKALQNLAYLAGDPEGYFPPKQEQVATGAVHPQPTLTMWGNYSNLRQTLQLLQSTSYAQMSLADQSNLHTAAGTLGMLAYNVQYLKDLNYADQKLGDLDTRLQKLSDDLSAGATNASRSNGEVRVNAGFVEVYGPNSTATTAPAVKIAVDASAAAPPEAFTAALEALAATTGAGQAQAQADLQLFKLLHLKEQVKRDRQFGFLPTPQTATYQYKIQNNLTENGSDFVFAGKTYKKDDVVDVGCDYSQATGNNFFGDPPTNDDDKERKFIRLATSLCPTQAKFPSLYYLFPTSNHSHAGSAPNAQPNTEPYIADTYIASAAVNGNVTYQAIADADIDSIALTPRAINSWLLPHTPNATAAGITRANAITKTDNTQEYVPFLDKGIFDGREMMTVRVLDIDLDMLRSNARGTDVWLPTSGLVYAFREDAMREDAIARPRLSSTTTWKTYEDDWKVASRPGDPTADKRMRVWANGALQPADPPMCQLDTSNNCTDPASNWGRGISPKPVDYYADPDRRPHGFRLRNGQNLTRSTIALGDQRNLRGMSFISDNPVYMQGDFNLHITAGTVFSPPNTGPLLEEFTNKLSSATDQTSYVNTFYNRTKAQLDTERFAKPDKDSWRPTEIIADAVTVLSSTFCDGTIQNGIRNSNAGCTGGSNSSYQNSHMKLETALTTALATELTEPGYVCENPYDLRNATVSVGATTVTVAAPNRKGCDGPVKVFRNGEIKYKSDTGTIATYNNYQDFATARSVSNTAGPNWVNAIIVSGIVPVRTGQANGGLVNFPRFLEGWDATAYATNGNNSRPLWFSGAMIQLNFSNYATAPWDQDAWEPASSSSTSAQNIRYYWAPRRTWGYDVALQYAPAGPVARRMVSPARERSEFYREPAADNVYICKLRDAIGYPCN